MAITGNAMMTNALARLLGKSTAVDPRRADRPAGRYLYLPHSGKRERDRRLRQVYRGQLPASQFQSQRDYEAARMVYLEFVSQAAA